MKTHPLIALLALSAFSSTALAQGSLTPPAGPPVASMKTLDQVEARTPLVAGAPGVAISAAGTITISQPGSYYLTKNVTITTNVNGIEINADATVDLNGFSIIGTAAVITTTSAVALGDFNIVLKNGLIKGGTVVDGPMFNPPVPLGFLHGVFAATTTGRKIHISDLMVTGARETGILVRRAGRIERCHVSSCGGGGIVMEMALSTVEDCFITTCSGRLGLIPVGIRAHTVRNCTAQILATGSQTNTIPYAIDSVRSEHCNADTSISGTYWPIGINAKVASYCSGRGVYAVNADVLIACWSEGGSLGGSKHLGTP
jgi:hypothetical protein